MKITAHGQRLPRPATLFELSVIAIAIGLLTGVGSVLFRSMVAAIHNLAFLGEFSFYYDPNIHTQPSILGPLIILSPVLGGLVVVFILQRLASDRRGQGVSDVIDSIYYSEGHVRSWAALMKSLAAGISSGSGASVGREAAIIQIGAALASRLGRLRHLPEWQRVTLVASGAAAGLAAAFNTPLGAVVFTLELMLPEVSARTFLPVTIAAGTGAFVTRLFFGLQPTFAVFILPSEFRIGSFLALLPYTVLGLLLGFASWFLIWFLGWTEQLFKQAFGNPYVRHAVGTTLVGLITFWLMIGTGHYYVEGASYAAIQDILRGEIQSAWFLVLLFVVKLLATGISLGSGGSGGVFSASLMIGAALGGAFGALVHLVVPEIQANVAEFSVVGMAAILGGTTGAALSAIVLVFEMTRDYNIMVPLIVGVTISIAVRRSLIMETIYTHKLVRKGHEVPDGLQANMLLVRHVSQMMNKEAHIFSGEMPLQDVLRQLPEIGRSIYVFASAGTRISGFLRVDPGFKLLQPRSEQRTLAESVRLDYVVIREDSTVYNAIGRLRRRGARLIIVVGGVRRIPRIEDIRGYISFEQFGESFIESVEPFAEPSIRNPFPVLYRRRRAQSGSHRWFGIGHKAG